MKYCLLVLCLFTFSTGFSQSLPINFEGDILTEDFVDFDGGTGEVVANPLVSGINTSSSVGRIIREGGQIWAGSKILLTDNLDFSLLTTLSMKVYTTAPIGTTVKFKLEGTGTPVEVDALTTVSGEWETLEWIFAGTPNNLNEIVFMFDYGNLGDGSETSTFYFDDVEQSDGPPSPVPTSLPIDFESGIVDSDLLNFAGATATVIDNPQMNDDNNSNTVCQIIREGGNFWAGSKIYLEESLDFTTMWHISMKIYTTAPVGTILKLELESSDDLSSLDYATTVSGEWETATWNFDGLANEYDRLNFLFDFGNVGDGSSSSTFLFDDVEQFVGPAIPDPIAATLPVDFEDNVVTSDFTNVFGAITSVISNPQVDSENPSATVGQFIRSGGQPWAQSKLELTEFMDFSSLYFIAMKVYTDAPVGTLLKLKVESTDSGAANEKDVLTTVSGEWQTYFWDFTGDPPIYNVITLMLGYATPNDASANATFLFDDIEQLSSDIIHIDDLTSPIDEIHVYPNPVQNELNFTSESSNINSIDLYDILGCQVASVSPNSLTSKLDVSAFSKGIYIVKVSNNNGEKSLRIIIE